MTNLIVGSKSGVGKYLKKYQSFVFGYDKDLIFLSRNQEAYERQYDTIIYFINAITGNMDDVALNKEILKKSLNLDFKNFIYFSSIDVLPKNECLYGTQNVSEFEKQEGVYSESKYECESLVDDICKKRNLKSLILRPSMILNPYSTPNSIGRIKVNEDIRISGESEINCIGIHSIGKFLKYAIKNELEGIYSLTSRKNTKIDKIITATEKNIKCGEYLYTTPYIKENPIVDIEPSFNKSSLDVALDYIYYGVY